MQTLVLHPALRGTDDPEDSLARLAEGESLTRAIDLDLVPGDVIWLSRPHPATTY